MMTLPHHQDPVPTPTSVIRPGNPTKEDKTTGAASAPYNFVPLPEAVVPAVDAPEDLPDHDRFDPERYTGHFKVTLKTKSPLYIRSAFTLQEFKRGENQQAEDALPFHRRTKNKAAFFHTRSCRDDTVGWKKDEQGREQPVPGPDRPLVPVIPGSSLRGMLRSLIEIVSHGKMRGVPNERLFHRSVGLDFYTRQMTRRAKGQFIPQVRAGFVRSSGGAFQIEPCRVVRVTLQDVCSVFGVSDEVALYDLGGKAAGPNDRDNPNLTPIWTLPGGQRLQHRDVWVPVAPGVADFSDATGLSLTAGGGKLPGTLVLTGRMQSKQAAFVFLHHPGAAPRSLPFPEGTAQQDGLLDLFHHTNQLTDWQESAFRKDQPPGANRNAPGHLRDGEPVFFLSKKHQGQEVVDFLGRAQLLRLPFAHTPREFVPEALRRAEEVDFADALFGFIRTNDEVKDIRHRWINEQVRQGVAKEEAKKTWKERQAPRYRQGQKARAYAGRITISDALLDEQEDPKAVFLAPLTPKILASPKPTCFPHYLVQHTNHTPRYHKETLKHYDSPTPDSNAPEREKTTIRGYKRYWLQGDLMDGEGVSKDVQPQAGEPDVEDGRPKTQSKQYTRMQPVRPGVSFTFTVHFENLTTQELGVLCWVLRPRGNPEVMHDSDRGYVHHLGMGKPLGFGAVALRADLHLGDRTERYQNLFDYTGWATPPAPSVSMETAAKDFEEHVLGQLGMPSGTLFRDLDRIRDLLTLMTWPGAPAKWGKVTKISKGEVRSEKIYLSQERRVNTRYMTPFEHRNRPVLPTPKGVLSPSSAPTAGKSQPVVKRQKSTGKHPRHQQRGHKPPALPDAPADNTLAGHLDAETRRKLEAMTSQAPAVQRGRVKWFNAEKGFGFVQPDGKGKDLFLHISDLPAGYEPSPGDCIQFEIEQTPKGRKAIHVHPC